MIADGSYDVFVVDATPLADHDDPSSPATGWQLELTILAGAHKGDIVTIRAEQLRGVEFDLIGLPGTLTVDGGNPAFQLDT